MRNNGIVLMVLSLSFIYCCKSICSEAAHDVFKAKGMALKATFDSLERDLHVSMFPDYQRLYLCLYDHMIESESLAFKEAEHKVSLIRHPSVMKSSFNEYIKPMMPYGQYMTSRDNLYKTRAALKFLLIHTYNYSKKDLANYDQLKPSK